MSDDAVLSELFGLLDLPRDQVSYGNEQLILAAIRAHRVERAAAVQLMVEALMLKLRALALNDATARGADGALLFGAGEMSSLAAANETMHQVMTTRSPYDDCMMTAQWLHDDDMRTIGSL